jgi:hypothetical protein
MLIAGFILLTGALALGLLLAALIARPDGARPSARISATHGLLGACGLVLLLLALRAPARGVTEGAGVFGWDAVCLLGAALALGLVILAKRRASGLVLVLHGVFAVTGYVILTSYISFRP